MNGDGLRGHFVKAVTLMGEAEVDVLAHGFSPRALASNHLEERARASLQGSQASNKRVGIFPEEVIIAGLVGVWLSEWTEE